MQSGVSGEGSVPSATIETAERKIATGQSANAIFANTQWRREVSGNFLATDPSGLATLCLRTISGIRNDSLDEVGCILEGDDVARLFFTDLDPELLL